MTGEKVLQPFQDSDRKLVALFNGNWVAHLGIWRQGLGTEETIQHSLKVPIMCQKPLRDV